MPSRDRAAYMREYRKRWTTAREKGQEARLQKFEDAAKPIVDELHTRIRELENEVARLKRDRRILVGPPLDPSFAKFNPAPKPGRK